MLSLTGIYYNEDERMKRGDLWIVVYIAGEVEVLGMLLVL